MIIYGSKGVSIQNGKVRNVTCPHCTNNVEMNYSVFGRYAHVYWIPFFPIGKEKILECNSCKSSYHLKDLPEQIKQKFQQEQDRNPAKTPVTHFSFLILIGIGVAIGTFFSFKEGSETNEFAKKPKVGDILYETTATGKFSTSKITEITKDSIFVMQNNLESESRTDVDEQSAKDENYTMPYGFAKKRYLDLAAKGDTIYKIIRK
jgi:zinc-ribbon family